LFYAFLHNSPIMPTFAHKHFTHTEKKAKNSNCDIVESISMKDKRKPGHPWRRRVEKMQKVAMITGGAQGIGRATAIQFAWAGYAVSIADIDKDAGVEIIQYIRKLGGNALFVRTDISSPEQVEKWFRLTTEELGR